MKQQFPLQAQADEIALRYREKREDIEKLRSKKPAEMIALMELRCDAGEEAADTLAWLAKNADAVRAAAGATRPPEPAPPVEPTPTEPEVDEWGDPIPRK